MKKLIVVLSFVVLVFGTFYLSGNAIAETFLWGPQTDVDKYFGNVPPPFPNLNDPDDHNACWLAAAANVLNYAGWNSSAHANEQDIYDWLLMNEYTGSGGNGSMAYEAYLNNFHPNVDHLNHFHQYNNEEYIPVGIHSYLTAGYGLLICHN